MISPSLWQSLIKLSSLRGLGQQPPKRFLQVAPSENEALKTTNTNRLIDHLLRCPQQWCTAFSLRNLTEAPRVSLKFAISAVCRMDALDGKKTPNIILNIFSVCCLCLNSAGCRLGHETASRSTINQRRVLIFHADNKGKTKMISGAASDPLRVSFVQEDAQTWYGEAMSLWLRLLGDIQQVSLVRRRQQRLCSSEAGSPPASSFLSAFHGFHSVFCFFYLITDPNLYLQVATHVYKYTRVATLDAGNHLCCCLYISA